jgi:uncharacterized protein (TIGR03083 family)
MANTATGKQGAEVAETNAAAGIAGYARLAQGELDAFLRLLEQLTPQDWVRPTPCSLWTVRDIVAHQAGHVQMGSGFRGFVAQLNPRALRPYQKQGMQALDALNQYQVDKRRERSTGELVAEVREGTPRSIASRAGLNPAARNMPVPTPGFGFVRLGTLLHRIFPRDMWIHRLDIADATGRQIELTPGHDGVLVAQAVEDVNRQVMKQARGLSFTLELTGPAGGTWVLGRGTEAGPAVRMDVPDFMRRTSGRAAAEATLPRVASTGPEALTLRCLEALQCLY